jgi:hypothetical protein
VRAHNAAVEINQKDYFLGLKVPLRLFSTSMEDSSLMLPRAAVTSI